MGKTQAFGRTLGLMRNRLGHSLLLAAYMVAIRYRHLAKDGSCPRCGASKETANHWALNASDGNPYLKLGPWIMWRLWKSRNAFYYRGEDYEPSSVILKAQEDLDEWNSRDDLEEKAVNTVPEMRGEERWTPLPHEWLKCNSDGAWDKRRSTVVLDGS
ncbi:uncharacterized protein LOC130503319 [Raphanus sativus]|uniref:Uncharacterized protein LOC130503319 n=1 Tax=Raphanus sativus TaxID=3726 RepID=A0A9W3CQT7_RAPSA|nr:uncharacterized protein LOC130503319 [Raphanus sativus]